MSSKKIKISIGINLQDGPWGGSNQFGKALSTYMRDNGYLVYFDLDQPDLDLILLIDPRIWLGVTSYNDIDIFRYLTAVNPNAMVVHRVNECDERKGTNYVNHLLKRANLCADHTVYVSSWLRDLLMGQGMPCRSTSAILNGSDNGLFNNKGYDRWQRNQPLKLLTHHWGNNWLKGFDIYSKMDSLMESSEFRDKYEFTYLGKLPDGFEFRNANYVGPKSGVELADAIRSHHVYLTATVNEPGSNHQNEGALCGLPLLYRESGCLREYCDGYGISFNPDNFERKLDQMYREYEVHADKINDYPHTSEKMCERYTELFETMLQEKDAILSGRAKGRKAKWIMTKIAHRLTGVSRRKG